MLSPNEFIVGIRFAGSIRKRSNLRHQERTIFNAPKKRSHDAGPEGNEYYQTTVQIPCFFRNKTTHTADGSVRKNGTLEYEPRHGEPEINAGAVITLERARFRTYRVLEVEDDEGVLGGVRVVRLTLMRTSELHATT